MRDRLTAVLAAVLVATALPVFAHHDFSATFDWKAPVSMTGTVSRVAWGAPHVLVDIDVRDARGETSIWRLELGSPAVLARYGWSQAALVPGERVRFDGWLARDGSKFVSAKAITLPGGRVLFGASSFYDTPGACVSAEYCLDEEGGGEEDVEYCALPEFDTR